MAERTAFRLGGVRFEELLVFPAGDGSANLESAVSITSGSYESGGESRDWQTFTGRGLG